MPDPLPPEVIGADIVCKRCAYSLQGLRRSSLCPECGLAIARSLGSDLLLYSDPSYVARLLAGAKLALWSGVAIVCLLVTGFATIIYSAVFFWGSISLLLVLAALGSLAGWWLLTSPDPGQLAANKGQRPRRIVRVALIATVALITASTGIPLVLGPTNQALLILLRLVVYLIMFASFWPGLLYVRWLAPRIPSEPAYKRASAMLTILASIGGAILLSAILLSAFLTFVASSNRNRSGAWVFCLLAVLVLVVLVFCIVLVILYAALFIGLRKELMRVKHSQPSPAVMASALKAPRSVVANADLRGNEYAWKPVDFPDALAEAARLGYRCIGGEFQFRFPDGIYDMYWLNTDAPDDRARGEEWPAYVGRCETVVRTKFQSVMASTNFRREAESFGFVRERPVYEKADPLEYLVVVAYFENERGESF